MNTIINADDFGISKEVNQSRLNLHIKGSLTSTTLIANSKAFDDAVQIAKGHSGLGIGVHLCLDGPFNIGKDYKTIIDNSTGNFYSNIQIISKFKMFKVNEEEIYKEYCLQIEKVLDSKIKITHLDHHHHLHLYIPAMRCIIKAARKYKIPYVRTQKMISLKPKSFLNTFYRQIHHSFLNLRVNTANAYFESSLKSPADFDLQYQRLVKLFGTNLKAVEIMLHPISDHDPETLFYRSERVMKLLANHRLINYGNLTYN